MSDDDDRYAGFLKATSDLYQEFQHLRAEVAEYRKTVNNALGLLSKELLDFTDTDAKERKKRQTRRDMIDVAMIGLILLTLCTGCSIVSLLLYRLW